MSLIGIGLTGLKAHQTALAVTGNNVTNANTEGYSRQRVELSDSNSQFIGAGYLGTGVDITNIKRLTDEYLTSQVRTDQSIFAEVEKLRVNVGQIDSLLADPTTGLSPAMSGFFGALQSAADDPASVPERQLLLTQAQGLTNRFSVLYNRLDSQARGIDQDMRAQVDRMNNLASGLAKVNQAIVSSQGNAQGRLPNDLLDQRDNLLKELSKITSVTTIAGTDGQTNVLIGNGRALVVGNRASQLSVNNSEEDPTKLDVLLSENGQANVITRELAGGSLGGVIHFRDNVLSEAFNSLGRIALVLADTINEQHQLGMDLEGKFGADFFEDINSADNQASRVFAKADNALPKDRVLRVEIMDSSVITTKDYQVQFAGPSDTDILVTNAVTGEKITRGNLTGFFPATFEFDGVRLNFESGSFQKGDSFRVSPTRFGARDVDMNITRVEAIALGSPIRTDSDLGNIGNARISAGELLDVKSPITGEVLPAFAVPGELTPPILVRFIADDYYEVLDNTDTSNPIPLVPPKNNEKYVAGINNSLFTADPGATALSAEGTSVGNISTGTTSTTANGYLGQNITIQIRDPQTGIVTTQPALSIANGASAEDIAKALSGRNGVTAIAYTEITLKDFINNNSSSDEVTRLSINGVKLDHSAFPPYLTTPPDPGTAPDLEYIKALDEIVSKINGDEDLNGMGLIARSDGTTVTIRALTGKDITVTVVRSTPVEAADGKVTYVDAGFSADDSVTIDTMASAATPTSAVTLLGGTHATAGGFVDVRLQQGVRLSADSNTLFQQAPVAVSAYTGFNATINGAPKKGDQFTIEYNTGGVSDNRNALAMAGLETRGTVGGEVSTYNEAYSQLVEVIGSVASQAELDSSAAQSLLTSSENRWQELSGVNLDEEAGKLIQFQAAYNASAQVVSIARQLFDTLLNTFR